MKCAPMRTPRPRWLEEGFLLVAAAVATIHAESPVLFRAFTFQSDAMIHLFWMRRFSDPSLFNDPLTKALIKAGYEPPGIQGIYWVAAHLMDPVKFGAWVPVVLVPLSVWLVFRIVRAHTDWVPAAWLGALLFLFPWDVHRFSGGLPRSFGQPTALLTLYFLVHRRERLAAVVPPLGALLYPPAALTSLLALILSALRMTGRRPRIERSVLWPALACTAATGLILVGPRLLGISHSHLISASLARDYPEFQAHGQMAFFRSSVLTMLSVNKSGFDLARGGSVLCVGALIMLAVRPRNARLVRSEVWWLAVASLGLFALSWAVLFRLYLPQRYTQPLLPVFCIVIAVTWRPTWDAIVRVCGRAPIWILAIPALPGAMWFLALTWFPLGPRESRARVWHWLWAGRMSVAVAVALGLSACGLILLRNRDVRILSLTAMLAAVLAGSLLVGQVELAGRGRSPALSRCSNEPRAIFQYLSTLPKSATIAGDPVQMSCVPIETDRPVVISDKLYQVFDLNYFRFTRPRMFAMTRAYYGGSTAAIADLRRRYGAEYIVVQTSLFHGRAPGDGWHDMRPFNELIRHLRRTVARPAALHLPLACRTYQYAGFEIFDLACVARVSGQSS